MKLEFISDTDYQVSDVRIKDFWNKRFCIFDFEATGLDENKECIIQIGAVIFERNTIRSDQTFNTYVKSPKPIPEAIERFTGIYNSDIENAPTLPEIYNEFVEFARDTILVTHAGYEYDLTLLRNECTRNNLPYISNQVIDTKALFTYLHPEVSEIVRTDYLIKHYDIYDKDLKRHDALGDSILIGRIFQRLLGELRERNMADIEFNEPITVKRVQAKPIND